MNGTDKMVPMRLWAFPLSLLPMEPAINEQGEFQSTDEQSIPSSFLKKVLSIEESLLLTCNEEGQASFLFWEAPEIGIVIGRGQKQEKEIRQKRCKEKNIDIVRRVSGGGTVLQGPGCLNYSFILRQEETKELKTIKSTCSYCLGFIKDTLADLGVCVKIQGMGDVTLNVLKIGGTAQARKKNAVLFHGTLLFNFDLTSMSEFLKEPENRPEYRGDKKHIDFVTTLEEEGFSFGMAEFISVFKKKIPWELNHDILPDHLVAKAWKLVENKYTSAHWNLNGKEKRKK